MKYLQPFQGGRSAFALFTIILLHTLFVFVMLMWLAHNGMPFHYYFGTARVVDESGNARPTALDGGTWLHAWHIDPQPSAANDFNYEQLLYFSLFHFGLSAVTYITVTYAINPPFGRYATQTVVPITIPNTLSWVLQEAPTVWNVLFFVLYEYPSAHQQYGEVTPYLQRVAESFTLLRLPLLLFLFHYIHRSFIFPFFLGRSKNDIPLHVNLCATVYCLFNGRLQLLANLTLYSPLAASDRGGKLSHLHKSGTGLAEVWLNASARPSLFVLFLLALLVCGGSYCFFRGMYINMRSDYMLIDLRRQQGAQKTAEEKEKGSAVPKHNYAIPHGFYFDRVSCPNFYGELVEWFGYSLTVLATGLLWSGEARLLGVSVARGWAAFSFFIYTAANLVPRARAHHAWYVHTFGEEYRMLHRRAIFPWGRRTAQQKQQ